MQNKICFYTCIGNNLSLIYYIKQNHPNYDIICNYYSNNLNILNILKKNTAHTFNYYRYCKFQALREIYSIVKNYDYIFIYDDDATVTNGSLNLLIKIMIDYNLDIVGPAHDPNGKISHAIHKPQNKKHIFRYTNFVEMNFPLFSKYALYKFMLIYEDMLSDKSKILINDWGVDYLYSSLYNKIGLVDNVIILNPKNNVIDTKTRKQKRNEWEKFKKIYNFNEFSHKTLKYIY